LLPATCYFESNVGKNTQNREPLLLWWMPVVALLAPLLFAGWQGVSADGDALGQAAVALVWPGAPLYLGALAVLWAGWKIELE
jgi:hypothetical protein